MKLLFFDIDGTLADISGKPSQTVVQAIRSARSRGNKAFLSTGRTELMIPDAVAAIGFDGMICNAGARVNAEGQELFDRPMTEDLTSLIIAALEPEAVHFSLECQDCLYEREMIPEGFSKEALINASSELQRIFQTRQPPIPRYPVSCYTGQPVYKIPFFSSSVETIGRLEKQLSPFAHVDRFSSPFPTSGLLAAEVSAQGVDKGSAIRIICRHYGAELHDCVAFGDSMNDAQMLKIAGIGVAMGNAPDEVKVLAGRVCESLSEDGVAKELYRMGLC